MSKTSMKFNPGDAVTHSDNNGTYHDWFTRYCENDPTKCVVEDGDRYPNTGYLVVKVSDLKKGHV